MNIGTISDTYGEAAELNFKKAPEINPEYGRLSHVLSSGL